MDPDEDFARTGFEMPAAPPVAPADSGQGELFGDDWSQSDAADREPVFWTDGRAVRRRKTTAFKPTRRSRNQSEDLRLDRE
jgi:hypothetical protein